MSTVDFVKAWKEAIIKWLSGEISLEELMEYGTIDEYWDYVSEIEDDDG